MSEPDLIERLLNEWPIYRSLCEDASEEIKRMQKQLLDADHNLEILSERACAMAVEAEMDRVEIGLAAIYNNDPPYAEPSHATTQLVIGRLCDEHLDRSGALLGRVRARGAKEER